MAKNVFTADNPPSLPKEVRHNSVMIEFVNWMLKLAPEEIKKKDIISLRKKFLAENSVEKSENLLNKAITDIALNTRETSGNLLAVEIEDEEREAEVVKEDTKKSSEMDSKNRGGNKGSKNPKKFGKAADNNNSDIKEGKKEEEEEIVEEFDEDGNVVYE